MEDLDRCKDGKGSERPEASCEARASSELQLEQAAGAGPQGRPKQVRSRSRVGHQLQNRKPWKKNRKMRQDNLRFKCRRDIILYGVTEQLPFPGAVQGCKKSLARALGLQCSLSGLQGSQLKGFQERNHYNS